MCWLHTQEFELPPHATRNTMHCLWPFHLHWLYIKQRVRSWKITSCDIAIISNTRNMYIFASRQCADYVRASYAGAGESHVTRYVCCRPKRSCLEFVVSKPWWPCCTISPTSISIAKECCRLHIRVEHIWMCQTVWRRYRLYLWYATTFLVTFLYVTHHLSTYVFCENRSSLQGLALMRSAIIQEAYQLQELRVSFPKWWNLSPEM